MSFSEQLSVTRFLLQGTVIRKGIIRSSRGRSAFPTSTCLSYQVLYVCIGLLPSLPFWSWRMMARFVLVSSLCLSSCFTYGRGRPNLTCFLSFFSNDFIFSEFVILALERLGKSLEVYRIAFSAKRPDQHINVKRNLTSQKDAFRNCTIPRLRVQSWDCA